MWYVSFSHFSYRMLPLVCNLSIRTGYPTLLTHTAESVEAFFFFFFETEGRQTQPTPNELRVCGSQSAIETLTLSPLLFHIYINISIYISTGGVQGGSKVRGMHHPSHWGDSQQLHPKGSRIQGTTACG